MKRSLWLPLTLACLGVLASSRIVSAEQNAAGPEITLRAYNNASVPTGVLIAAERDVTRIFAKIGVVAAWVDSPRREEQPFGTGLSFVIIILERPSVERLSRSRNTLGSTPLGPMGSPGNIAYVFYERVENSTVYARLRSVMSDISQVLAFAIAHEMGHMLLPDQLHSPVGIMRGSWGLDDFAFIATGQLEFTAEQARLMKSEVLRRSR